MSKVFVTGSTGFIGKRLIGQLLEQGHTVYALCRIHGTKVGSLSDPNLHIIYGDLEEPEKMDPLPFEIDAAYYLVHSMAKKIKDLKQKEKEVARSFVGLIDRTQCRQIIYLGGIIEPNVELSPHLLSRQAVEEILKSAKAATTVLRTSIIIGSGSASFEIIRDLVEKLPAMVGPKWVKSLCQPIGITDVLYYLKSALLNPLLYNQTFDIGGPEVMSFKEALLRYAKFRGLKRFILEVPFLTPKLSSYWLVFVTSVRFSLCSYLVESMKCNSVCINRKIQELLPHECSTYEQALERAFLKISRDEVESTWMDAWLIDQKSPDIARFSRIPSEGCFREVKKAPIIDSKKEAIQRIWSLGGDHGWYGLDWAWKIRGFIDKLFHGPGLNRGRRHPSELEVGDPVDFWRVVKADKTLGHLILYAEMNLPGEAWLEFQIDDKTLFQIVVFRPKGLLGRLYWYAMLPFHFFIFRKMIQGLARG
ncbi:MAG: SDR family oxidoreductase [Verrucomicrobia bacterium]|nr:SDR family oxidoreductase [Verrucomicrobiota bacterium]